MSKLLVAGVVPDRMIGILSWSSLLFEGRVGRLIVALCNSGDLPRIPKQKMRSRHKSRGPAMDELASCLLCQTSLLMRFAKH